MHVNFAPDTEKKLTRSAARQGLDPDELVQEVVERHFDEERRFIEAVTLGEGELQLGEYLTHEQVGERLQRYLRD